MRARWNETTGALLEALSRVKGATVEQLAEALEAGPTTLSTILLRLYRGKNVEREKLQDGIVVLDREEKVSRPRYVFLYSITQKGRDRLAWIVKSRKSKGRVRG